MDRTPQPARTGLTERLAPDINRINFYRFCQLLEQSQPQTPPLGSTTNPADDPVRFRPHPGMGFPVSELKASNKIWIILTRHPRCAPRFWGCTVWIHRCRQLISTTSRSAGTAMKR